MSPIPPTDRAERLRFLELGPADLELLSDLGETLLPHLDQLIERWHQFLLSSPAVAPLLDAPHGRGHLKESQRAYFRSLFAPILDDDYLAERARVGRVHHQVGLAPFWYLGAYRKFLALVSDQLRTLGHPPAAVSRWSESLEKVVTLDLATALDAYQEQEQTSLLRSNQELERQMQRAGEASRIKEEFLSRISHDLRTPLHGMLGFTDLVADGIQGPVTPDQRESLAKVRVHGERLVGKVDQLIEAAKLSAATGEPTPFDPTSLLEEAAAVASDAATLKALRFTTELHHPLPRVMGDRRATAMALRQLLDNAVRFTDTGSVSLRVLPVGKRLRIEVADSGPGIPRGEIERVFAPLHQVETADSRSGGGPGIGLTLAREAIQRSGGVLELAQTSPAGSIIAFELPLAADPPT